MTDFRTPDQIQADLRALNPNFRSVTRSNDLLQLLSDRPMAEASAAITGNGPVLFHLGVLDGPEWQGVRDFLASRHVTAGARRDFQALEADLRAADTNGDGYLNNQEIVSFATSHNARWNTVAAFRSAAEAYLNRLPSFVGQPNLNSEQVSKLYGLMNYYAQQWQDSGTDRTRWGTVMGLSLEGFPSTDTQNPPDLIARARDGRLTPQQAAAVHRLLAIPHTGSQYDFAAEGSDAPLRPEEIGMLGQILQGANGHTFQGMTIVSGDAENAFFAPRNEAARRFQADLAAAQGNPAALRAVFENARTTFAPFDADHPEQISATTLLARAYMGDLNPTEIGALRVWMRSEAGAQGMTCNGTLDCLRVGAMRFFRGIARDPMHFFARNGGMLAASYLYRRFVLRNVVENRLSQLCGPNGADPNAFRNYENFVQEQMRSGGLLKSLPRRLLGNPYVGLAVFNLGVAPLKDTGSLPVDMLTDLPLVPLMFQGLDTYDAFKNPMLQQFANRAAGAGACRPNPSSQAQPVAAPEAVTAAAPAQANAREMTQADFEAAMNGLAAPALTPLQIASLPQDLQGLFTEDIIWGAGQWDQQQLPLSRLIPQSGDSSPIADAIVQRFAADNPALAAQIRADIPQITAAFRQSDGTHPGSISSSRTNAVR
ncbi:MAG TPA: hypothetical protein VFX30_13530, partial [bacterium]|nr:hypothetical protein [bacterium]